MKVPYRRTFGDIAFAATGFASKPVVSVFLTVKVTSPLAFVVAFRSAPEADSEAGTVIFVLPESQLAFERLYGALICRVTSALDKGVVPSFVTRYFKVRVVPAAMYV